MAPFTCLLLLIVTLHFTNAAIPLVLTTWNFQDATKTAWSDLVKLNVTAIDAVVSGATTCEILQCDYTVGFGGSPDENGETTLDAMVFDGKSMNMGAVAGLRRVKNAVGVARYVLENTEHSILVGDLATEFAKNFQFKEESLSTDYSTGVWKKWQGQNCQPNFWTDVSPDPKKFCGPYKDIHSSDWLESNDINVEFASQHHDTIGIIVIDSTGNIAAATSSNGATHKIPGRVGDAPLPGAGAYADNEVGAAVATGDGDIMMRFLPSFLAVEELRRGISPSLAAQIAIERIVKKYPNFMGAVLVTSIKGEYGAACNGIESFPFVVGSSETGGVVTKTVPCKSS